METENSMIDFKQLMNTSEYDFLRTEKRLGNRIILLGLGGSYAYGTCNENSDIDFRGITLNMPSDLIGLTEFEQYEDANTDTVIYSFNKIVRLLLDCNPNTCEILGLDEDQYLIKSKLGQELLDHKGIFLSKRAAKSFGGYAGAQLRRLQNAIARDSMPQTEKEQHILRSVRNARRILKGGIPALTGEVSACTLTGLRIRNWRLKSIWMRTTGICLFGIMKICGPSCTAL